MSVNRTLLTKKELAVKVLEILEAIHPVPKTELHYTNEMQLAVAVALSAQTTDKKVNEITNTLFKKYPTWEAFASADLSKLQSDIKGVNFHLGKAERLKKMAALVLTKFDGCLPRTMPELITLPGFARKSSNVVLQELWNLNVGIVVDTHVTRVSTRLGLTSQTDPVKIEQELMSLFPQEKWHILSSALVLHGRYVCVARSPKCKECPLNKICPFATI